MLTFLIGLLVGANLGIVVAAIVFSVSCGKRRPEDMRGPMASWAGKSPGDVGHC